MSLPYSHQFIVRRGLGGVATYTCPGGRRAIVRCIDAYCEGTAESTLFIEGSAGQTITKFVKGLLGDVVAQWNGRQVLDEGEQLTARVDGHQAWDVTISGYELKL